MDLTNKKLILIPVNNQDPSATKLGGTHWSLLIFRGVFEHFDSCTSFNHHHAQQLADIIHPFVSGGNPVEAALVEAKCEQQRNGYDCGVHLMANAELVCREVMKTRHSSPVDVDKMRKRVTVLIDELKSEK